MNILRDTTVPQIRRNEDGIVGDVPNSLVADAIQRKDIFVRKLVPVPSFSAKALGAELSLLWCTRTRSVR